MKKFVSFLLSFVFAGSLFAQMSGYSSGSYSDGTTLGANETISANGIALGNAVKPVLQTLFIPMKMQVL